MIFDGVAEIVGLVAVTGAQKIHENASVVFQSILRGDFGVIKGARAAKAMDEKDRHFPAGKILITHDGTGFADEILLHRKPSLYGPVLSEVRRQTCFTMP